MTKKWFHCFIRESDREVPSSCPSTLLNAFLVALFILLIFIFSFSRLEYDFHWAGVWAYRVKFVRGLGMTLVLSFFSLIVSFLLGALFALGQKSRFLPFYFFSRFYVEIIRGLRFLFRFWSSFMSLQMHFMFRTVM